MERKALKKHAKGVLKRNYLLLVAACLIAALLGVEFTGSLSLVTMGALGRAADDVEESGIVNTVGGATGGDADLYSVLLDLFGQAAEGSDGPELPDGPLAEVFGTSRGVFASLVNGAVAVAASVPLCAAIRAALKRSGLMEKLQ